MSENTLQESEKVNQVLDLIWSAVDKNFLCIRPGAPNFYKPLRARGNQSNSFIAPYIKTQFTCDGKDYDTSFQVELPVITAIGLADFYAVDPMDSMDRFDIEKYPEYQYKLAAFNALIKQANLAASLRLRQECNTEDLPKDMQQDYRYFVKFQLCQNYIRLHQPVVNSFVDLSELMEY